MESLCDWAEQTPQIKELFFDMLNSSPQINSEDDRNKIIRAFNVACEAHKNQKRNSGEPYITHPIAVAKIVGKELGCGKTSVMCALLHDVVEDNPDFPLEYIKEVFGEKVSYIVDGLTKLSDVFDDNSNLQVENFLKLLRTIQNDVRVVFVKLADRLHNMRTLEGKQNTNKWLKTTGETLHIYAPLAHRLGLHAVKAELEDLSFKHRTPERYENWSQRISSIRIEQNILFDQLQPIIEEKLNSENLKFQIIRKQRSVHSIWRKTQNHQIQLKEVTDVATLAIVFEPHYKYTESAQCWRLHASLAELSDYFSIRTDIIKDYTRMPRANGYQALILPIMFKGKMVQLQILTSPMHQIAERGLAALRYLRVNGKTPDSSLMRWVGSIIEQLTNGNNYTNSIEFFEDIKLSLFASDIHVFTPKGHYKTLPKGATLLDFAFEIHSDLGRRCTGGYVNDQRQQPQYILKNFDQVQVLSEDYVIPQTEWLDFVKTTRSKTWLKSYFLEQNKESIKIGREKLNDLLRANKLSLGIKLFEKFQNIYQFRNIDDFHHLIGINKITETELKQITKPQGKVLADYPKLSIKFILSGFGLVGSSSNGKQTTISKGETFYLKDDSDPNDFIFSACCKPIPGDELMAYQGNEGKIVIHKKDCIESIKICASESCTPVQVAWSTVKKESILTRLKMKGLDRMKIIYDITFVIGKQLGVNLNAINIKSFGDAFEGYIDVFVHNEKDLTKLVNQLKAIKNIESVEKDIVSNE